MKDQPKENCCEKCANPRDEHENHTITKCIKHGTCPCHQEQAEGSKDAVTEGGHDFVPAHPDMGGKNDWCTKCGLYIDEHDFSKLPQQKNEKWIDEAAKLCAHESCVEVCENVMLIKTTREESKEEEKVRLKDASLQQYGLGQQEGIDYERAKLRAWVKKRFIDFSKKPEGARLKMNDGDIGYMSGVNDTVSDLLAEIDKG